jgi:hypothetical protein
MFTLSHAVCRRIPMVRAIWLKPRAPLCLGGMS